MANRSGQSIPGWPVGLTCVLLCAAFARAQDAPGPIPEVIVTAQRGASPASKTPVAMSVLSGDQLARAGIDNPAGIGARLPNVQMDGSADGLRITIRGVSNADTTEKGDPSAAFMLDGIYIARPQIQNVSLFDLARIEVLRGPQGTLYGRNTTAGVVNLISNAPGKLREGAFALELGDYASRKASAMINLPLGEALAVRAAMAYNKHDSYLINGQGSGFHLGLDRDDLAARLSARLALGGAASLLLRYDHSSLHDNNDSFVPVGNFYHVGTDGAPAWTDAGTGARLNNGFVPPNAPLAQGFSRATTAGVGAEFDWNLGAVSLHYLGAHRSFEHDSLSNFYYKLTPAFAIGVRESFSGQYRQNSHELRLATNGGGPLAAQAGLYYFREQSKVRYSFRDLELLGLTPYYVFPHDPVSALGKAVFGQATYSVTPRLRATAGLRFSQDDKIRTGSTNFQQADTFNPATDVRLLNDASLATHKRTWRLGAEFDLAPRTMLFATVSTGYKAGGFNDGCLAGSSHDGVTCPAPLAVSAAELLYQPETLTSWEAGVKTRFWENRASLQATAFYYDYANLQLSGVVVVQGAPRFVTTNAGVARVKGLEFEGQVSATAADKLSYALALLDARYASYSPDGVAKWDGKRLDRSPRATLALGYEHRFRIGAARLDASLFSRASSAFMISVPSQLLQYRVPARTESELGLNYAPDQANWQLQLHVKNLENKVAPIAIDSFGMVVPSDPRTLGLRLETHF